MRLSCVVLKIRVCNIPNIWINVGEVDYAAEAVLICFPVTLGLYWNQL